MAGLDEKNTFFDINDKFFVNFCKNASIQQTSRNFLLILLSKLQVWGSFCREKQFFDINDKFLINFCKNTSKQQKSLE